MSSDLQQQGFDIACENERLALSDELASIEAIFGSPGRTAYILGKAAAAGEAFEAMKNDISQAQTVAQGTGSEVGG